MTKTCKRTLFITVLTLLLTACMCFAVGCDGGTPQDSSVEYSVTVYVDNAHSAAASGVKVTVKKGGASFGSKTTDENGAASFKLVPDSYTVTLSDLPYGYSAPDGELNLTKNDPCLTVSLVKNFGYTVNLVDEGGKPYYAEGVEVGICTLDGHCLTPVALGSDGSAFIQANPSDYHVQIQGLPHNVAYEQDEDGYYTGREFSAEGTEMSITLHPVTDVLAQKEMTQEEKEAYAAEHYGFNASKPAYKLSGTLKPGETAYYGITPAYSSVYNAYNDYEASYIYNGNKFQLGNNGDYFFPALKLTRTDKTYYFNVSNTTDVSEYDEEHDITFECVISAPVASYHAVTSVGAVTVSFDDEDANAIIELTPPSASAYKLTAEGDALADIVYCPSNYDIENTAHDDDAFKKNASASAKVTGKSAGSTQLYFAIAAKDVKTLKIKVEKLNDITDNNVVKHVSKPLANFTEQDGKLTYVAVDGTAELYYDEENGYYTLGEGGPIVVVRLTTPIDDPDRFYADGALAYLEYAQSEGTLAPYVFDTTTDDDKIDLTKGNTITDYRVMLRGFGDYDFDDGNPVKPEITEASYYAKHVNTDGVYPLTKELEEYLKLVAANYTFNMPLDAEPGCEWLFACYYYAEAGEVEPVIGTYNLVSFTENGDKYEVGEEYNDMFGNQTLDVTSNSFVLKVTNTGFTITDNLTYYYEYNGTWTKQGDAYKLCLLVEKQNTETWVVEEVEVEVEATVDIATGKITITYDDDAITFEFIKKAE